MVNIQDQHVILSGKTDYRRAHQMAVAQFKVGLYFRAHQALSSLFSLFFRSLAEIMNEERQVRLWIDDQNGFAIGIQKTGPESLMPLRDGIEGTFQGGEVKWTS